MPRRPRPRTYSCRGWGLVSVDERQRFYRRCGSSGSGKGDSGFCLEESQQQALTHEIDRVTSGFRNGEISYGQLGDIAEKLSQDPAFDCLKMYGAEDRISRNTNFSSEEKRSAELIIRRYVYGVLEGAIPSETLHELLDPLLEDPGNSNEFGFRSDISDEELRSAIAKAKVYADAAGIGETNISPDFASHIRKVIDEVVGKAQ